jgi:O-antigen ligase
MLAAAGVAAALFFGVNTNLRWTIYLLFVPLGFAALFAMQTTWPKLAVLLGGSLLLEGGAISFRPVGPITVGLSLPIVLLLLASRYRQVGSPRLGRYAWLWAALLATAAIALLRHVGEIDFEAQARRAQWLYAEGFLFFVLGMFILRTFDDVRALLWVLVGVGVAFSVLHFIYLSTGEALLAPIVEQTADTQWRYGGPLGNPNSLAAYYVLTIPAILMLLLVERRWLVRALLLGGASMIVPSLVLTASRGGTISALLTVSVVLVLAMVRGRRLSFVLPTLIVVGLVTHHLVTTQFGEAFQMTVERFEEKGLEDMRSVVWEKTIDIVTETPGGIGFSYSSFMSELVTRVPTLAFSNPHNTYLEFAVTLGVHGLLIVLLILAAIYRDTFRALTTQGLPQREQYLILALLGSVLGFMFAAVTEPIYDVARLSHLWWFLLGALLDCSRTVTGAAEPAAERAPPAVASRAIPHLSP